MENARLASAFRCRQCLNIIHTREKNVSPLHLHGLPAPADSNNKDEQKITFKKSKIEIDLVEPVTSVRDGKQPVPARSLSREKTRSEQYI